MYRLYDDKNLERLQQILFFREIDFGLKDIKSILDNPNYDKKKALEKHKELLELKRDRMDRLIELVKKRLKGERQMNFKEFNMKEINNMKEKYKIKKKDPVTEKKRTYLPIIPDLNIALKNLSWSGEEWNVYTYQEKPEFDPDVLFDLEGKIRKRYEKLMFLLIKKVEGGFGADDNKNPITKKWLARKNQKGFFGKLGSVETLNFELIHHSY